MKQWFDIHKKEWEGWLYENGTTLYEHFSEVMVNVNDLYSLYFSVNLFYILKFL